MAQRPGQNRHHFLPQFYLRRWTAEVQPPREPFLYVYRRGHAEPEKAAPKNVAWKRGLYEIAAESTPSGDSEVVERALADLESEARHAFAHVDMLGTLYDAPQIAAIAQFVAVQHLRTQRTLVGLEWRAHEYAKQFPADFVQRHGGMKRLLEKLQRDGVTGANISVEEAWALTHRSARNVAQSREHRIRVMLNTADRVASVLRGMNWCLVTPESPEQFITGDHPVVIPTVGAPARWWETPGVGFATPGVEVWFPLDPNRALVASRKPLPPTKRLGVSDVRSVNEFVARSCLEFVLAHRRRPRIGALMASLEPSVAAPGRADGARVRDGDVQGRTLTAQ